jgi:hypothetical protein
MKYTKYTQLGLQNVQHEIGSDLLFLHKYHAKVYRYKGQPIPHTRILQSPTPGTTLLEAKSNRITTTDLDISFLHF